MANNVIVFVASEYTKDVQFVCGLTQKTHDFMVRHCNEKGITHAEFLDFAIELINELNSLKAEVGGFDDDDIDEIDDSDVRDKIRALQDFVKNCETLWYSPIVEPRCTNLSIEVSIEVFQAILSYADDHRLSEQSFLIKSIELAEHLETVEADMEESFFEMGKSIFNTGKYRPIPTKEPPEETQQQESGTYSVAEIAVILGIGKKQVYTLVNQDPPPFRVLKIGKSIRIPKQSFHEWFDKNPKI
jgi:excisionase family DNA binding protein